MPELMRSIITRLRSVVGNRRRARRYRASVSFSLSLLDIKQVAESAIPRRLPQLEGHTRDLSETGLALVVPTIRIGDHYLTGADRRLLVTLLHPTAPPLTLQVRPVRYEQLDEEKGERGYLIGVRIEEISDTDRARFIAFLETLEKQGSKSKDEG